MSVSGKNSWNASSFKILLKKLSLSPSTRKSWVQILVALLITFSIVGVIAWLENEQKEDKPQGANQPLNQTKIDKKNTKNTKNTKNSPNGISTEIANQSEPEKNNDKKCKYKFNISTIICLTSELKLLEQVQNIAVLSAAILFFWDTFDRKKQLERQAWQLIDGAQGSETSGARKQAIKELYEEDADITGLDADGADLRGINLSDADLTGASFKNAILEEANFEGAILKAANFTGANLKGADLRGANLIDANLTGANLRGLIKQDKDIRITTKLQGAKLRRSTLNHAQLHYTEFGEFNGENTDASHAYFREANISSVEFKRTNIEGAYFGGAKTGKDELKIEIISKADNYENAYYSQSFLDRYSTENYSLGDDNLDKEYEKLQRDISKQIDLTSLKDKENISSLNLTELLKLLEYILVESARNTSQNYDKNDSAINVIISLQNKLADLDALVDYASQQIPLMEKESNEMDDEPKRSRQELSLLGSKLEEHKKNIAQQNKNNNENPSSDNQ